MSTLFTDPPTESTAPTPPTVRPLHVIADDVCRHWPKIYFGAVPYVYAMRRLDSIGDTYGADSAVSVVLYFLSNATTWRGPDARRIKAELKGMLPKSSRR